jgi:hypothetical protein
MRKNIIRAAATATALLVAGCSAPDNATETVPAAPAVETVTAPIEESKDVPSGIAGLTIAELHQDAAEALASFPEGAPAGTYTFIPEYAASYETAAPAFPADYFTVESFDRPGVIHVYHVTAALRA